MNVVLISPIIKLILLAVYMAFYYLSKYKVVELDDTINMIISYSLLGLTLLAYAISGLFFLLSKRGKYSFLFYVAIFIFFGIYIAVPKEIGAGFHLHEIWLYLVILFSVFLLLLFYLKSENNKEIVDEENREDWKEHFDQERIDELNEKIKEIEREMENKNEGYFAVYKNVRDQKFSIVDPIKYPWRGERVRRDSDEGKKRIRKMEETFEVELREIRRLKEEIKME